MAQVWIPHQHLSDDEYYEFCMANPDVQFERTAEGEIIVVPPAGFGSDHDSARVVAQLMNWADSNGRGVAFGSTSQFRLPTGAAYSPDAGWISKRKLSRLSPEEKESSRRRHHCRRSFGGGDALAGESKAPGCCRDRKRAMNADSRQAEFCTYLSTILLGG